MTTPETLRRPGYASENAAVGRRGQHTRERILACAAELFVAEGYHGTAMEAIARAVGGSRATVYQYFKSKHEIFLELAADYRPTVLAHARSLGRLGPDEAGLRELHRWLIEWAKLRDEYAIVFVDFPGVGIAPELADDNVVAGRTLYTHLISEQLRASGVSGIDAVDAAAALLRLANVQAANGLIEQARASYKQTGLDAQQCSLVDLKPAMTRSGASDSDFPMEAMRWGFEGWVRTEFDIASDGRTANQRVLIAYPPLVFRDAGLGIAKSSRWEPRFRPEGGLACGGMQQNIRFLMPK